MRILVTAASKHGATAEIAVAISGHLRAAGLQATCLEPDAVADLEGYDAVVLGSGVYAGHWLDPARRFAERFADQLQERAVWLFSSGPVGEPPRPQEDPVEIADLLRRPGVRGHAVFTGRIDKSGLGFAERAIVRALRVPDGDFRDWPAIERWATEVAAELAPRRT